jgi:nucleoside-triphosphatase
MAQRIAVTGSPGVGKSTLVQKAAAATGCRVGGVLARDRLFKDRRVGFELLDLATGATGTLADESGSGPQLGKYRVHPEDLDSVGAQAVENALARSCNLIVIDEVGPMELTSRRFVVAVEKALSSDKPMLVVLHEWSQHRLAKKIRGTFKIVTVTQENRDSLVKEIAVELRCR